MAHTNTGRIKCAICESLTDLKRCGFCKSAFYCSRDHQMRDWTRHKPECNRIRAQNSQDVKSVNSPTQCDFRASTEGARTTATETNGTKAISRTTATETNGTKAISRTTATETNGTKAISQSSPVAEGRREIENNEERKENVRTEEENTVLLNERQESVDRCTKDNVPDEDVIPFDTRPVKQFDATFLKIKADTDSDIVAKTAVEKLNSNGYCVMDELFSKKQIKNALKDINACLKSDKFESGRLAGGRTSGERDKQNINSTVRSDQIMWLEGTETDVPGITRIVAILDEILTDFNQYLDNKYFINGRTKAMVACYPGNGTYYRRHVDNPHRDGRVVTCILYLNEDWNVQEDGGLLRIFPADNEATYVDVPPLANRLLFFWSDRRNPHEVQPAYKTRFAITVWYMDDTETKQAKLDSKHAHMANVRGEYLLKVRDKCQHDRDTVNRQLEDAASKAITALSLEELQAMAAVVGNHPNPDEIFAQMGVSPNIRTKLLEKLKQLNT